MLESKNNQIDILRAGQTSENKALVDKSEFLEKKMAEF
jgi:hypothetical protein